MSRYFDNLSSAEYQFESVTAILPIGFMHFQVGGGTILSLCYPSSSALRINVSLYPKAAQYYIVTYGDRIVAKIVCFTDNLFKGIFLSFPPFFY